MINVKDGVRFKILTSEIVRLLAIIDETWIVICGKNATITSGNDSTHMAGSKHYINQAIDVRTKDLSDPQKDAIFNVMKNKVNPLGYDVVFESRNGVSEHLHFEWDPK